MESLKFFDPDIENVIDYLDDELDSLPKSGYVKGRDFNRLLALIVSLSDVDSIKMLAKGSQAPAPVQPQVTVPQGVSLTANTGNLAAVASFDPTVAMPAPPVPGTASSGINVGVAADNVVSINKDTEQQPAPAPHTQETSPATPSTNVGELPSIF